MELDDSLLQPGEGEILADLLVAAHADGKRKLDEAGAALDSVSDKLAADPAIARARSRRRRACRRWPGARCRC